MVVKIEKDGWIVSGSSRDGLKMAIEVVQEALQNDVSKEKRGPGRPRKKNRGIQAEKRVKRLEYFRSTLLFLQSLEGHDEGMFASQVTASMGAKGPWMDCQNLKSHR